MAQQRIIPESSSDTFPACALNCTTLVQAQNDCIPPNVKTTNQWSYDTCFCMSAFLTPLATTTDAVCTSECALLRDRQVLQAWYNNFCSYVQQGIDPTTKTTTRATILTAGTATSLTQTIISSTSAHSTSPESSTLSTVSTQASSTASPSSPVNSAVVTTDTSGLSTTAKIAIAAVVPIIVLVILAAIAFIMYKRRKTKQLQASNSKIFTSSKQQRRTLNSGLTQTQDLGERKRTTNINLPLSASTTMNTRTTAPILRPATHSHPVQEHNVMSDTNHTSNTTSSEYTSDPKSEHPSYAEYAFEPVPESARDVRGI